MPPSGYVPARLVHRDDFAPDLARFLVEPAEPLDFAAGQYATLALEIDGALVKRPYSIASAPAEPSRLDFYLERVPHGALTPRLFALAEGDTLWMRRRAAGHFVRDPERRLHVMAATVTGLAPFLSMVLDRLADGSAPDRFLILHGASHPDELGPYHAELAALAEAHEHVRYVPTVSRPWEAPGWTGERGRVEDVLRKHLDALGWSAGETAGYACGNPQMIETVRGLLRRAGVGTFHEEKYFTAPGEPPSPAVQEAASETAAPRPSPPSNRGPGSITLKTVPRPDA